MSQGLNTPGTESDDDFTEDSAVSRIEALLSAKEDAQPTEAPAKPTKKAPAPVVDADEDEPSTTDEGEEPEEEQSDEPEADADEPAPEPRKIRVKVDGEEIEVTEDEAARGYSRTQDYTRKTQQAAELRKQAETEQAEARAERQRNLQAITQYEELAKSFLPAEPDWVRLRQENPDEFPEVWTQWQQHKAVVEKFSQGRQELAQRAEYDRQQALAATLRAESAKLVEAIPAWKNDETAAKEKREVSEFAKSLGYTDTDLADVTDHRVLVLLRKAMLFDRAEKGRPNVQQKIEAVKAATPGPASSSRPKPMAEITKRALQARRTGSVRDAAAVIESLL